MCDKQTMSKLSVVFNQTVHDQNKLLKKNINKKCFNDHVCRQVC